MKLAQRIFATHTKTSTGELVLQFTAKKIKRRYFIMTIEKDGKVYTVRENKASWTVSKAEDRVTVSVNVPKADYPTFESMKAFVAENDIF